MEYMKVGTILNTRGIKGELKVRSLTDFAADRFETNQIIFILFEGHYLKFKVKSYVETPHQSLLVLKDHEDINAVEKYKGCDIFVVADSETTLYEDEYHLNEIIDMKVFQNGKEVGVVKDVLAYPQGDYLEVAQPSGKRSLIPFRDEFILDMDLDEQKIEIIDMEGLL